MPRTSSHQPLPAQVEEILTQLGGAIRAARHRRRWPQALLAEKAAIAIVTLQRAERGHPGVSLATYATILWALNLAHLLAPLADPASDRDGLAMSAGRLGERIYPRRDLADDF